MQVLINFISQLLSKQSHQHIPRGSNLRVSDQSMDWSLKKGFEFILVAIGLIYQHIYSLPFTLHESVHHVGG